MSQKDTGQLAGLFSDLKWDQNQEWQLTLALMCTFPFLPLSQDPQDILSVNLSASFSMFLLVEDQFSLGLKADDQTQPSQAYNRYTKVPEFE